MFIFFGLGFVVQDLGLGFSCLGLEFTVQGSRRYLGSNRPGPYEHSPAPPTGAGGSTRPRRAVE
jgi:hypothetical protein